MYIYIYMYIYGDFHTLGYPKMEIPLKWMIGGTPNSGSHHIVYIYICIYIWDIVCRYVWGYASDIIMGFRAPETGISHDSVSQHFSGPTINNRGYQYVYL